MSFTRDQRVFGQLIPQTIGATMNHVEKVRSDLEFSKRQNTASAIAAVITNQDCLELVLADLAKLRADNAKLAQERDDCVKDVEKADQCVILLSDKLQVAEQERDALRAALDAEKQKWRDQYALTCSYIECLGIAERSLGALVDAVNVEFGDGKSDISGKTGPALIGAVNALAEVNSPKRNGPVGPRLQELRDLVKSRDEFATLLEQMVDVAECADETGYVEDLGFVDLDALHKKVRDLLAKHKDQALASTVPAPKPEGGKS